jgi:hypothetical protein
MTEAMQKAKALGREYLYGGGVLVHYTRDGARWFLGTVTSGGDQGDTIVVETQQRVGEDLETFPPERVRYAGRGCSCGQTHAH